MSSTNPGPDSSPKSPTSSNSGDEEEYHNSNPTVHPGSPSNAHQSSDESSTSDGVLVELPHNPHHDARGIGGDPDGGVLVNIDGSMQEGREDLFLDAPEDLSSSRGSLALDESMAVIDYGETSVESTGPGDDELARMRDRLDETLAQCRKYKEEREVLGKEVSSLRHQLREISYQQSLTGKTDQSVEHAPWMEREGGADEVFTSPSPLHSMVSDCSKMLSHLKRTLNDRVNSVDTTEGLSAALYTKEKELEDLSLKLTESNVCQDVIISYLGSVREIWSQSMKESTDEINKRLLASLETAVGQGRSLEDSSDDGISLVEKKTLSLIQKYSQMVSESQQLKQFLTEMRPDLLTSDESEFSFVYNVAHEELLESKRKETTLLDKTSILEDENRRMAEVVNKMREELEAAHAETNKTKLDLEQAENKLASAREKLSIAVTKGKSLVQHRDALKQSLAEKTSEVEKSVLELQQQSSALKASEARIEELNQLLAEKTNELDKCLLELKNLSTFLESTKISGLEKASDLEKCLLELQQKSESLANAEARAEVLEQSLAEKTSDLDKFFLELKQTSYALENSEANCEKINTLLAEKNSELEKCMMELQQKSDALENSGVIAAELRQTLAEKTSELENCLEKLQQIEISESVIEELKLSLAEKTNEHEKSLLQWQQKSDALEASEASAVELKQTLAAKTLELENCLQKLKGMQTSESIIEELKMSLAEKNNDLEKCLVELQKKDDALNATEVSAEELRQMLGEKTTELKNCLQQVQNSESIVEELKASFAEKTNELEKCQLELQEKSDTSETTISSSSELIESQNLLNSLRESISEKDRILQEIEELTQQVESPDDLLSMAVVDRVRWFVNQNLILGRSLLDNSIVKEALSPIELPENVSSTELDSQIYWLVKSFTQAKEDIVKLVEEIAGAKLSLKSHESELFETHKEIDRLSASLLEVKHEKDFILKAYEILKTKYETVAERLSSILPETGRMVKELTETSMSSLDDQSSLKSDLLIEKCIDTIGERIKILLTKGDQFEEIKGLLFVKYQEQRLCENILEEEIIDQSRIHALSAELQRLSEEVTTLKNEKEAMQKELERVEERSSLIREKLSMAVKKGKGLVQEREGFKNALDEKNSEIEKLKQELRLHESATDEYKRKIESLSALPEHIQKLESDIVSLNDLREQSENLLQESNNMLHTLIESIEEIVLPTDKIFEKPVEKVGWIAEHIHESEFSRASLQRELEEVKAEATLQVTKLNDAFATIKLLEDELAEAERHIHNVTQEKEDLQLAKVNIAQELEKLQEESSLQASKLEDTYEIIRSLEEEIGRKNIEELEKLKEESSVLASQLEEAYATIKSLENAVTDASKNISVLEAEKHEIESKSKQEIFALSAKLAECMEELVGARNTIESKSSKMDSHFRDLLMLLKDEGPFSLLTEEFEKYIESLRHIGLQIQNLHLQFTNKGLHIHNVFEHDLTFLSSSLPRLEDFINDGTSDRELSTEGFDDVTTFSKIVEGFHSQAKLLSGWFQSLSSYTDNYIAMTGQALQATSDEFIYMLELSESLKLKVNSLEEQNAAQEVKLSSFEKEMAALLSACQNAIQEHQVDFSDSLDLEPEQDRIRSSLTSNSTETAIVNLQEGEAAEFAKLVEGLLLASKKVGTQAKQLMNANRVLETSVAELKSKFEQAELAAEMAIQDRHLGEERLLKLEKDLEEMQNVCREMKDKIEENQAREDILRDREAELSSSQNALISKARGTGESLISESQVEVILEKVNKMEISFHESTAQMQEVKFSCPVDKLFYILENFTKLQQRLDSLTYAKEDMQLILESHLREMENLKKANKISHMDLQDLESKKLDLIDLTVGLEKIIQRFGASNLYEDQKPAASKGLLSVLERLMITSNSEVENLKSRLQELGAKFQAKEKVINELSAQNKLLEDSIHGQLTQLDIVKERAVFDASTVAAGSEISEIEDVGPPGKNSISPASGAARTMRRGSTDHLVLSIDADADPLVSAPDIDDKGHVFKSLNTSGLIPRQGKPIADRVDGIWVSGGRILMNRPRARLGLIAYWIFLHLWLLGSIL